MGDLFLCLGPEGDEVSLVDRNNAYLQHESVCRSRAVKRAP